MNVAGLMVSCGAVLIGLSVWGTLALNKIMRATSQPPARLPPPYEPYEPSLYSGEWPTVPLVVETVGTDIVITAGRTQIKFNPSAARVMIDELLKKVAEIENRPFLRVVK